jgi:nitrate/nitrite-specific signal transduction histidine kinase
MRGRAQNIGAVLDIVSAPTAGTRIDLKVPAARAYLGGASWIRRR